MDISNNNIVLLVRRKEKMGIGWGVGSLMKMENNYKVGNSKSHLWSPF
jgi:hypothetical protein